MRYPEQGCQATTGINKRPIEVRVNIFNYIYDEIGEIQRFIDAFEHFKKEGADLGNFENVHIPSLKTLTVLVRLLEEKELC